MDRKIDAGALLVAAAALLLVVSLFLGWFGFSGGSGSITAWEAFEVLDLLLLAAALAAVAAAFGLLDSRVLLAAALVVVVVVVSQLIQPPPAGQGAEREVGAWLALVASGLLLGGAALTAAQIAVTVDVRGRERRRRVATVDKRAETPPREDEDATEVDHFAPPGTGAGGAGGSEAMAPGTTEAFEAPPEAERPQ